MLAGVGLVALLGCAVGAPHSLSRDQPRLWNEYSQLPEKRALAIAGDLRKDQWVAGLSGGQSTDAAAKEAALRECARRRLESRMQAPCHIYAVGDREVR